MALFNSLDKKRIAFVGNSFTFYGGCVRGSKFDELDDGCFYKLAHSFGDDVTVTNFTWGGASFWHKGNAFSERALYTKMKELHPAFYNNPQGLPLDDFYRQDIVIFQQSGDRIAETYEDAMLIAKLFPNGTRFGFYVTTYDAFHSFEPSFFAARRIRDDGGAYIPLGHMVDDIINQRAENFGGELEYNKNSFVVCREHDGFHPNTLTGYLTALCVYCALTERNIDEIENAEHSFVSLMGEDQYTKGMSNYAEILSSKKEMKALKRLVFEYVGKYNGAENGCE